MRRRLGRHVGAGPVSRPTSLPALPEDTELRSPRMMLETCSDDGGDGAGTGWQASYKNERFLYRNTDLEDEYELLQQSSLNNLWLMPICPSASYDDSSYSISSTTSSSSSSRSKRILIDRDVDDGVCDDAHEEEEGGEVEEVDSYSSNSSSSRWGKAPHHSSFDGHVEMGGEHADESLHSDEEEDAASIHRRWNALALAALTPAEIAAAAAATAALSMHESTVDDASRLDTGLTAALNDFDSDELGCSSEAAAALAHTSSLRLYSNNTSNTNNNSTNSTNSRTATPPSPLCRSTPSPTFVTPASSGTATPVRSQSPASQQQSALSSSATTTTSNTTTNTSNSRSVDSPRLRKGPSSPDVTRLLSLTQANPDQVAKALNLSPKEFQDLTSHKVEVVERWAPALAKCAQLCRRGLCKILRKADENSGGVFSSVGETVLSSLRARGDHVVHRCRDFLTTGWAGWTKYSVSDADVDRFLSGRHEEAEHVAALLLKLADATDPTNLCSLFS